MADGDRLAPEASSALDQVGAVDLVAGVAALDSAAGVRHVVEAVAAGLARGFPGRRAVVVVADGGSRDGTPEAARQADTGGTPLVMVGPPVRRPSLAVGDPAEPGKGAALPAILAAAERTGARACAVVDGDVRHITPEWVPLLMEPVLDGGLDLVAPVYARHKYDGMITTGILYPLTRALYGRRLRQPVGAHFGISGTLARRLLDELRVPPGGNDAAARQRLDLWMVTEALADGRPVGQAHLGIGRRGPRDAAGELVTSFAPVVGAAFALMEERGAAWAAAGAAAAIPTFGAPLPLGVEPVSINVDRMLSTFRQGQEDLMPVWRRMLAPETCRALAELVPEPAAALQFPPRLWAQVVYDAATALHRRTLGRDLLLRALVPLYLGRTAAFVLRTATSGAAAVENDIEELCGAFEALKPYLRNRWAPPRA